MAKPHWRNVVEIEIILFIEICGSPGCLYFLYKTTLGILYPNSTLFGVRSKESEDFMIVKAMPGGYKDVLEGVSLKNMVHGERTHLTKVKLKKGAVVPEHQHHHEQTGHLISGRLKFFNGDEETIVTPGDSWIFLVARCMVPRRWRTLS